MHKRICLGNFLESAIRCAYDLGSADKIGDTASLLRQDINDMFESEGSSLSLPPTAIFIFTSPFLRVLAVLISARWMVLRFTGKQVNISYSSEQRATK
jgi:hypothetical protein